MKTAILVTMLVAILVIALTAGGCYLSSFIVLEALCAFGVMEGYSMFQLTMGALVWLVLGGLMSAGGSNG